MSDVAEIVGYIVSQIPTQVIVSSINGVRIYTCDTLYATECKRVTDSNNNLYEITAFVENEWIELEPVGGAPAFNDTVLNLTPIYYLFGTPMSSNQEYLNVEARQAKKTPFIWLLESYEETEPGGDSSLELTVRTRLFFMDGAIKEKLNADQHRLYIKPMKRLAELFKEVVKTDYAFKLPEGTTIRPRARFGVEIANKGNKRLVFDDGLSGVEMNIFLEIFNTSTCFDKNCN